MRFKDLLSQNLSPRDVFLKNSFWLFLSQGASKIFKFLLVIFAARILSPSDFGVFNYIISIVTFIFLFSDAGIGNLVIRDFQQKEERKKYLNSSSGLKLIFLFLSLVAAIIFSFFYEDYDFRINFILLSVFFLLLNIRDFVICFFRALQKMEKEFWIVLAENLALAFFGFFLLLIYKNILSLSLAYVLGGAASLLVSVFLAKNYSFYFKPVFDFKIFKELLKNGIPSVAYSFLGFIFFSSDQIILGRLKSMSDVGYYSVCARIILLLNIVPSVIVSAIGPHLFSKVKDIAYIKDFSKKIGRYFLALGIIFSFLGFILSPIINLIFGSSYGPSIEVFKHFSWILIFMFPAAFYDSVLFAYNKQWINFLFTSFCALLNVILNFALIPKYGMFGAVWASSVSQFLNLIITWRLMYYFLNKKNG